MDVPINEVGTGVIIAILLIREVKPFILKNEKSNGKSNGKLDLDKYQTKDTCEIISKNFKDLINDLKTDVRDGFKEVKDLIGK